MTTRPVVLEGADPANGQQMRVVRWPGGTHQLQVRGLHDTRWSTPAFLTAVPVTAVAR